MTFDGVLQQLLLFGGAITNETWAWDGSAGAWQQVPTLQNPPLRDLGNMAFDAARGNMVLFGGAPAIGIGLNDTWVYGPPSPAGSFAFGTSCPTQPNSLALNTVNPPGIGTACNVQLSGLLASEAAFFLIGWSDQIWSHPNQHLVRLPFPLAEWGLPCTLQVEPAAFHFRQQQAGTGAAILTIPIPAQSTLRGTTLFLQGTGLTPAGVVRTSHALGLRIG